MALDFKALGPLVGAFAPTAGSIIADMIPLPIPGKAAMGRALGTFVANQFGVDPAAPDATKQLSDRIVEAGEETARAKINAAVEEARIKVQGFVDLERETLQAQVKNLSDVNATIRAERLSTEHWFYKGWRPAFGWSFVAVWSVFGLALSYVTLRAAYLSSDPLTTLSDAWPLFASYFAPGAAVLGVLIPSRTAEKRAAMETGAPMPHAAPPKALPPPPLDIRPPPAKPPARPVRPERPPTGGM